MDRAKLLTGLVGLGGFAAVVALAMFGKENFAAGLGAILALAGMFTKGMQHE